MWECSGRNRKRVDCGRRFGKDWIVLTQPPPARSFERSLRCTPSRTIKTRAHSAQLSSPSLFSCLLLHVSSTQTQASHCTRKNDFHRHHQDQLGRRPASHLGRHGKVVLDRSRGPHSCPLRSRRRRRILGVVRRRGRRQHLDFDYGRR